MIHSHSLGAIRSINTRRVHPHLLVKVRPRADLVNGLRRVRPYVQRPGPRVRVRIRPPAIGRPGRLHDARRNDGAERLQAVLLAGHGHLVVVEDHGAAAAAVGRGPVVDGPAR